MSGGASLARGARRAAVAADLLGQHGVDAQIVLTEKRGHAHELADAARRRGDRLVVAWGGDGTINEIASALVGGDTALGIIPSGSGNGLARELGVPTVPADAVTRALSAAPRRIDAGQLGGRWFFSIAGIGFDAQVASAFDRDPSGRRGLSTYARITARELWRYQCLQYRVDGGTAARALLVAFANSGQFGNGARIAPCARLDDGLLDMVIVEETSRLATLLRLPHLFSGRIERVRGVTSRCVTSAVVESDVPMLFHVDGEPVQGGRRLEARVEPGALLIAA